MTNPYIEALASLHAAMGNIILVLSFVYSSFKRWQVVACNPLRLTLYRAALGLTSVYARLVERHTIYKAPCARALRLATHLAAWRCP